MYIRSASVAVPLLALCLISPARNQESGYLSQQLLLENTIQQRVTDAVSKILDESRFVVDVDIDLEFTPTRQVETVYRDAEGRLVGRVAEAERPALEPLAEREGPERTVTSPFPIPGFPEVSLEPGTPVQPLEEEEEAEPVTVMGGGEADRTGAERVEQITDLSSGLPKIKSMAINVILEDGVSPQIIENVRQVTLIASRFDRDRGDVLSITTASFRDRRPSTREMPEEVLAAAQRATAVDTAQTRALEQALREARERSEELMRELRERELEYLQRSEEERKQALADLAQVQNERAKDLIFLQQQREEQNARLQEALLTQIDELRKELTTGRLPTQEQEIVALQATSLEDSLAVIRRQFEAERERLQSQIEAALNKEPTRSQGLGAVWADNQALFILAIVIILAAIILVVVLLTTARGRAQSPAMGMVYPGPVPPPYTRPRPVRPVREPPPRPRKKPKPKKAVEEAEPEKKPEPAAAKAVEKPVAKEEAPSAPTPEPAPAEVSIPVQSLVEEDPEVLRSEVKSIRQSVVSMSVGRPETASRIISSWLTEETPASAEEPSEPAAAEKESAEGPEETREEKGK